MLHATDLFATKNTLNLNLKIVLFQIQQFTIIYFSETQTI